MNVYLLRKRKASVVSDKEWIEREEKRRKDHRLIEEEQTMVGRVSVWQQVDFHFFVVMPFIGNI